MRKRSKRAKRVKEPEMTGEDYVKSLSQSKVFRKARKHTRTVIRQAFAMSDVELNQMIKFHELNLLPGATTRERKLHVFIKGLAGCFLSILTVFKEIMLVSSVSLPYSLGITKGDNDRNKRRFGRNQPLGKKL